MFLASSTELCGLTFRNIRSIGLGFMLPHLIKYIYSRIQYLMDIAALETSIYFDFRQVTDPYKPSNWQAL